MSETDDEFWEDLYDKYVEEWIDEDFKEDDEKGFQTRQDLVEGEGEGTGNLHNAIFNRIKEAAQKPSNQGIGYFKDARRHGMVMNKDKFVKIAQERLQDSVGKEEVKRVEKVLKERPSPKGIRRGLQETRTVTEKGKGKEEEAAAESFRKEGDLASSYIARLRAASGDNERISSLVREAQGEISGNPLGRVERAAEFIRQEGTKGEV